jgi:hypothetical protein
MTSETAKRRRAWRIVGTSTRREDSRELSPAQPGQELRSSFRVGDATTGSELLLGTLDISRHLELFEELLVCGDVHEHCRSASVLGEEHGSTPSL